MALSEAKFVTGSTMRHVVVMSLTGSLGLMFMFLIDAAALFWVSQLRVETFMAALGFAWTIQFSTVSLSVGMAIGAIALISRAIGREEFEEASHRTTSAFVMTIALQSIVAVMVFVWRHEILAWTGASGETLQVAARYLAISVPSLPLIAASIIASTALRAAGDVVRSMMVTLSSGAVAMVLDPALILWAGLGVDGAAIAIILSRFAGAALGITMLIRTYGMIRRPSLGHFRSFFGPYMAIAIPSILTQLAAPFGNYVITYSAASFGDSAVAGWAVIGRLSVLIFGGIFAMAGAIGGIFGQNYGAGKLDRVASAYRDAMIYSLGYIAIAWIALFFSADLVIAAFGLSGDGAQMTHTFMKLTAGATIFYAATFAANSAFANLDRPLWGTGFNWLRDGLLMIPCVWVCAQFLGVTGPLWGQVVAAALAGCLAYWTGARYIISLEKELATPSSERPALQLPSER